MSGLPEVIVRLERPSTIVAGTHAIAVRQDARGWFVPVTPKLLKLMGNNTTVCFFARVEAQGLRLLRKAPWQTWA